MHTNTIDDFGRDAQAKHFASELRLDWTDPNLARITRLRLLGDRGYPALDVSYCWGETRDGQPCRVDLPFSNLPKAKWRTALIAYARREGVYAKGLGIFDAISIFTD